MKRKRTPGPVKKVAQALEERPAGVPDITEGFRRARSSISDITTDLQRLRRRARSTVKGAQRPAKSK
jgi:hypothetical protein